MLHVRGAVEALDELKQCLRAELVELRERLLALFALELAGVVEDEAVDDLLEAGVLLFAQQRQARSERVHFLRRRLTAGQADRQAQERVRHEFLVLEALPRTILSGLGVRLQRKEGRLTSCL